MPIISKITSEMQTRQIKAHLYTFPQSISDELGSALLAFVDAASSRAHVRISFIQ